MGSLELLTHLLALQMCSDEAGGDDEDKAGDCYDEEGGDEDGGGDDGGGHTMIMLLRSLGKGLQTALACRRALMRVGSRKVCGNGNDVDIHVGFNVDLEAHDDTDKLVPSVRPCLPSQFF